MLWSLAFRNAKRNVRRSALTATTVSLGCALLIIGLSWLTGVHGSFIQASIESAGLVRIATQDYVRREALLPIEYNLVNTDPLIQKLNAIEAADHIYPKITQGVAASKNGTEIGEVFGLMIGAPLDYFEQILNLPNKLSKGSFFDGQNNKQVLIGQALAKDMNIEVGDEAIFLGQTQDGSISPIKATVQGVVDTGNGVFDRQAYVPLNTARWMADIPDGSTELLIYSKSDINGSTLANRISQIPSDELALLSGSLDEEGEVSRLKIQAWDDREPFGSTLRLANLINGIMAIIIVFITALGVLNTMMMSVLERTNEIGVLRALGMKGKMVAQLFIFEAMIISSIGGVIGSAVGSAVSISMQSSGIDLGNMSANLPDTMPINTTLYPHWDINLALATTLLGLLMALIGAAIPAIRAVKIEPVEAMRSKH